MSKRRLIESALQNEDCFIATFSDYTNVQYVLNHMRYQKPFIHKLLANDNLFIPVVTSNFILDKLIETFPQYRHRFIKRLLRNDILFARLITQADHIFKHGECKKYRRKLISKLTNDLTRIKTIVQHASDIFNLAKRHPHYNEAFFNILRNDELFKFYIKDYYDFVCAFEIFTTRRTFLVEKIISDNELFTGIFKFTFQMFEFANKHPIFKQKIINKLLIDHELLLKHFKSEAELGQAIVALPENANALLNVILNNQVLYLKIFHGLARADWCKRDALSDSQPIFMFLHQFPQYTALVWTAEVKHRTAIILNVILTQDPKEDGKRFTAVNSFNQFIENIVNKNQLDVDKVVYILPFLNKAITEAHSRPVLQEHLKTLKVKITDLCPLTLTNICINYIAKYSPLLRQQIAAKLPAELYDKLNKVVTPSLKL